MSIHQQLTAQIQKHTQERRQTMQVVEEVLEKWRPEVAISSVQIHTLTLSQLRHMHGQQVVISMMVQDCLEPEFYAGALLPKCGSDVIVNKYWASDKPIEDFDKYESLLLQREVYHVVPIAGQSEWVRQYQHTSGQIVSALLNAFDGQQFKLGQVVQAVCLVDFQEKHSHHESEETHEKQQRFPSEQVPRLNLLRLLTEEEVVQLQLNIEDQLLLRQVDFAKTRSEIIAVFEQFASRSYSQALLCSLIGHGATNMYLPGQNLYPLIQQLLPHTLLVSLKLPLTEKLFPYKQGFITQTLMQVSQRPTFVVVDFTDLGAGKIGEEEINTLKLLKLFAEEGQLLYRWEYGETLVKVDCSGIIARGSTIIKPTVLVKNHQVKLDAVPTLSQDQLWTFRAYLAHCRKALQAIEIDTKTAEKIKNDFLQERQQEGGEAVTADTLSLRLLLARVDCASRGSSGVSFESYRQIRELVSQLG